LIVKIDVKIAASDPRLPFAQAACFLFMLMQILLDEALCIYNRQLAGSVA
jgi:hypothetical protein